MKPYFKSVVLIAIILIGSCKKDAFVPRSTPITKSLQDFYNRNKPKPEIHFIDAASGGSFTSAQGTTVTIPSNAFVDQNNNPVTGTIKIEFLDVYKKSDMLWTGVTTQTGTGEPLKSGGEFFIKAMKLNGDAIQLNQNITVDQPLNNAPLDTDMEPFIIDDSAGVGGWEPASSCTTYFNVSGYVFSLYQFSTPLDSGTWCNSDNQSFFSAYPQTQINFHYTGTVPNANADVFMICNNINTMIHVYEDFNSPGNFPYLYAPVGMSCTLVAITVKDGKLYSSFTPFTVGNNQNIDFGLTQTTEADFKTAMEALN